VPAPPADRAEGRAGRGRDPRARRLPGQRGGAGSRDAASQREGPGRGGSGSRTGSAQGGRDELIETVALRTLAYSYRIWGFGEGLALVGVLRAAERLNRPQWIEAVADLIAPTLPRGPSTLDHLISVEALTELGRLRPDLPVQGAIDRFRGAVVSAERPVPGQPPVHRPDLSLLGTTIWVECLHTDGPGLPPEQAAPLVEEVSAVLQDESGLFSHGYNVATGRTDAVHWGRGQGWALYGLRSVQADPSAVHRIAALTGALQRYEHNGSWHTIVDDPDAPTEYSLSAMVAASDGVRAGDPQWIAVRQRALATAVAALDGRGGLPVSVPTPIGPARDYLYRDTGIFPWGQGPLLLALLSDEL
jgi:unsaturated rhamnogalacturonyl hydrolase